ncbi:cell wall-active antibiotics response protein LiaF [Marinilactibacillus sp. Marseille-P9653]|uniref:cell wall-active antibiotics response protein LiaF n=1 Tax=Marinilactibacillus sp. Marseille-P9653 TaxID=2866583 RepID=UPI001CE407B3|nr:cell wall-active antibiotics response protein LiaF [Marinilactibacillus sp. Marseille-P9653]
MNHPLFKLVMGLLGIWLLYDIVTSGSLLVLFLLGLFLMIFPDKLFKKNHKQENLFWLGLILFLLSIFFTSAAWVILIVLLIFKVGEDHKMFKTIKDPLTKKQPKWREKDYVSFHFKEEQEETVKLSRKKWFGDDSIGYDIYEWDDINFSKAMGDTVIDLGNTILPKKENIVMIRKVLGDTKLLIPEEVGVSLDLSVLLGKVKIGNDHLDLKNETLKWQSATYPESSRKIKIVLNALIGEVEVIFI